MSFHVCTLYCFYSVINFIILAIKLSSATAHQSGICDESAKIGKPEFCATRVMILSTLTLENLISGAWWIQSGRLQQKTRAKTEILRHTTTNRQVKKLLIHQAFISHDATTP